MSDFYSQPSETGAASFQHLLASFQGNNWSHRATSYHAGTTLLTSKAVRLRAMERLLRSGCPTRSDFIERTHASLATFKRDLEALREEFGADIAYDPQTYGYCLRNREWAGVEAEVINELGRF